MAQGGCCARSSVDAPLRRLPGHQGGRCHLQAPMTPSNAQESGSMPAKLLRDCASAAAEVTNDMTMTYWLFACCTSLKLHVTYGIPYLKRTFFTLV